MVAFPRLHAPGVIAMDILLPPNQADTSYSRNFGFNIRRNVRGLCCARRARTLDSGDACEFVRFEVVWMGVSPQVPA